MTLTKWRNARILRRAWGRKSREAAKNKILSQDVNVNFKTINQNDYNCQLNDIISIKKVGRFKIKDIQTNPKSGKIILSIDKYR